jgi:hypothetical protein
MLIDIIFTYMTFYFSYIYLHREDNKSILFDRLRIEKIKQFRDIYMDNECVICGSKENLISIQIFDGLDPEKDFVSICRSRHV